MLILPGERVPIARMLVFLEYGERMAHACARSQAALAPDSKIRRFVTTQARQEAMHAVEGKHTLQRLALESPKRAACIAKIHLQRHSPGFSSHPG